MTQFRSDYMEIVKTEPNIFSYATNELSQDAFI